MRAGHRPVVFGDGLQSRDFTYVDNVVAANLLAATAGPPTSGQLYNVACGERRTLLDLVAALNRIFGTRLEPVFEAPRAGDVRHSLAETIARLYRDSKGILHAIAMDPRLEQLITNALQHQRESSPSLGLPPETIETIHKSLTANLETTMAGGYHPVILCVATVRPYFYRLIRTSFPNVAVLSFTELPPETEIEFIGRLEVDNAN
jgi:hypothetical protein